MSSRTTVTAVLNTLEGERYARGPLIAAFADDLRAAIPEAAPESTRSLAAIAKAEAGDIDDTAIAELLTDLRSMTRAA